MHDNLAHGVLDFIRVFSIDIVFANGDRVMRRIARLGDAMTGGQHPVFTQDGAAARGEGTGTCIVGVDKRRRRFRYRFRLYWPKENIEFHYRTSNTYRETIAGEIQGILLLVALRTC